MREPDLFWFRTRQDLLEEWGYVPGIWHLVRRSPAFITVLALDARGQLLYGTTLRPRELTQTRLPLALIDLRLCNVIGPFAIEAVSRAGTLLRGRVRLPEDCTSTLYSAKRGSLHRAR